MTDESGSMVQYEGEAGVVPAYLARPRIDGPRPGVIVIHEIMGLTEHIKSVANRFAEKGYVAFAPDLFARPGLGEVLTQANIREVMQFTSTLGWARMSDRAAMQEAISQLPQDKRETVQRVLPVMFGGIPKASLTQDLVRAIAYLDAQDFVQTGKIASVGFCFGGGMSINLACHARLAACVLFYGENPQPTELVEQISCPVLCNYGAEDMRINAHLDELVKAMATYKKDFEMRIYPHAGHAFFNDTAPTYRAAAAKEAWESVQRFYERTLLP